MPTEENFREFIRYLEENSVDLTEVKVNVSKKSHICLFARVITSRFRTDMTYECHGFFQKCPIDKDDEYPLLSKPDAQPNTAVSGDTNGADHTTAAPTADEQMSESEVVHGDVHRTTDDGNMSEAEEDDTDIHSHTDTEEEAQSSEQLQKEPPATPPANVAAAEHGKNHLMCRWSTGTGPRIRCVRDYPQDLQSRALEHVNLSPRLSGSPSRKRDPVPSPRPSPAMILSPRLASVGFQPQMAVSLTLPDLKRSRLQ
jgi:hypothetical protein